MPKKDKNKKVEIKTVGLQRRNAPKRQFFVALGQTLAGVILILTAIYLLAFGAVNLVNAQKIYPRVKIAGENFGSLTPQQAKQKLSKLLSGAAKKRIIITSKTGKSLSRNFLSLGFNPDIEATVKRAYLVGRSGSVLKSFSQFNIAAVLSYNVELVGAYDREKVKDFVRQAESAFGVPERDASLIIEGRSLKEMSERIGVSVDKNDLEKKIIKSLTSFNGGVVTTKERRVFPQVYSEGLIRARLSAEKILSGKLVLSYNGELFELEPDQIATWIDFRAGKERVQNGRGFYLETFLREDKIKAYAVTLAKQIDKQPKDAKLTIKDGKAVAFIASQKGIKVEQDKLVAAVREALSRGGELSLEIPIKVVDPLVSESEVNNLGIKEKIGEATTSFRRSPKNRIHNIKTGAKFLNGQLIKPGQTFSTLEALGKIDGSSGYLPELVIKENRTIPEYGGGLCQVSTTLFRAVLNAGLPIVERQNHSWRVSYYEPPVGLDATIYLPKPDFKFKNDTSGWILIQSKVQDDNKITFELYGTSDGRRAKIIGPTLLYSTSPPETVYVDDDSLPEGELKRVENAHPGGKATATYKVFDKSGKLINKQVFVSKYKAVPARYLKGTGPKQEEAAQ